MNDIVLRPGEALRIESASGSVFTIFAPGDGERWELRLGPGAGNSLAARIHHYRQQDLRRQSMARLGLV